MRIETGAVVKNRKGMSGVEGGEGTCYQWKEKGQRSKGDQCSFKHQSSKPDHKAATLSEPSMSRGRNVSRKRSFRGKSNHGAILRQTRDRFVNIGIHPNVNFTELKRAAKQGISVCSRVIRLMNNQTKSQIKRLSFPQKRRKRRQACSGDCENCTIIGLRLARLGCVGFSKRQTVPSKHDAKSLGINSKKYGALSLRYIKQVSAKRKDHRVASLEFVFGIGSRSSKKLQLARHAHNKCIASWQHKRYQCTRSTVCGDVANISARARPHRYPRGRQIVFELSFCRPE